PIVGDRKYGARSILRASEGGRRIALHARSLTFSHPTRRERLSVEAPAPADWPSRTTRGWAPIGRSRQGVRPAPSGPPPPPTSSQDTRRPPGSGWARGRRGA